ncbi:BON domain-containing protein [Cupriavidus sp. H18C2]|uniref:BON domain-containing protein n=2 Tax=Pseudomonadota TaxID=1224 RepID=UPI003BF78472
MRRGPPDDRYLDTLRQPPRGYGGDPRRMEQMRYTGRAGWGIDGGYPDEIRDGDRYDGAAAYRPGRGLGGPKGYTRSDERIREDLCERLAHARHVDVREVEVNVTDGWVKLTGTVPARQQKYRIEDIAAMVSGVKDVENDIRVVPGTQDTSWTGQPGEPGLTGQPGQADQPGTAGQSEAEPTPEELADPDAPTRPDGKPA